MGGERRHGLAVPDLGLKARPPGPGPLPPSRRAGSAAAGAPGPSTTVSVLDTSAAAAVDALPLLLADEPTARLDPTRSDGIPGLLRAAGGPGRLAVAATHDQRVLAIADLVVEVGDRHAAG